MGGRLRGGDAPVDDLELRHCFGELNPGGVQAAEPHVKSVLAAGGADRSRARHPFLPVACVLNGAHAEHGRFERPQVKLYLAAVGERGNAGFEYVCPGAKVHIVEAQPVAMLDEPDAQTAFAARGVLRAVLLGGIGRDQRLALAVLRMHAEGGDVQQVAAGSIGLGKRRRGHAFAPIAGERLVLVDDLGDGIGRERAVVLLRVFAIDRLGGGILACVIPGHLGDIGHLGINGVGQPPGQAVEALEIRRAVLPGLDGLREIQVVGVVVFRAAAVTLQPGTAPVLAVAVDRAVLAARRVLGDGRADYVRGQGGHVFGADAPTGDGHADLRGALLDRLVEAVKDVVPDLVARLV